MLAIIGSTGKLGTAALSALQTHSLLPASSLVLCTTSSHPSAATHLTSLVSQGATLRPHTSFDSPESLKTAFTGCDKLLLISSPAISLDFHDAPEGQGREKHHVAAIRAAVDVGVRYIFYTSLGFDARSGAGVMRAHKRTEAFLAEVTRENPKVKVTVLKVGLYSESWPLYFGYYDAAGNDARSEVVVAGDGKVKWTAIKDLGLATALVLTEKTERFLGKTVFLSAEESHSLSDVARIVSKVRAKDVKLKVVSREEYCKYYVEKMGRDEPVVEWWSSTYQSLANGDCDVEDGTFSELLAARDVKSKPFEETVREMLSAR